MSENIVLIKKSKTLTEIVKAIFGADVKSVFVTATWYTQSGSKAEAMDQLRFRIKNLEEANKGFVRHKDNTGTTLHLDSDIIVIEYKDGRLVQLAGSEWSSAKLIGRQDLEEIL